MTVSTAHNLELSAFVDLASLFRCGIRYTFPLTCRCYLFESDCSICVGQGPELTDRIKAWARRPSNRSPGRRLLLSDIWRPTDSEVVTLLRSPRSNYLPMALSELYPNPFQARPREIAGTSSPAPQPFLFETPSSMRNSRLSRMDRSSTPFTVSDYFSIGSSVRSESSSPSDAGCFSAGSLSDVGENDPGPRAYSSGADNILGLPLTSNVDIVPQYPNVLHQPEILENPHLPEVYGAGWLVNSSLANSPHDSAPFVPSVNIGNDLWDIITETTQSDPIDTGVLVSYIRALVAWLKLFSAHIDFDHYIL